jgi:AraC-like DNA-binding protein
MPAALVQPVLDHVIPLAESGHKDAESLQVGEHIDVLRLSNWLRDRGEQVGDPRLGLNALGQLSRGLGGLIELAAECAPDLRAALLFLVECGALVGEHLTFHLHIRGGIAALSMRSSLPLCQALRDYQLGLLAAACESWASVGAELELWFSRPAPSYAWEYRHRLKVRQVSFGASCEALVLPAARLSTRQRRAEPTLHQLLARCARQALAELGISNNFSQRVRKALAALLREGASRKAVASTLDMSTRTLSRYLEHEGLDFSTLLDEVRSQRSIYYLTGTTLDVKIIAEQLGYATSGSFVRAFMRWHGQTPGSYRQRAVSASQQAQLGG